MSDLGDLIEPAAESFEMSEQMESNGAGAHAGGIRDRNETAEADPSGATNPANTGERDEAHSVDAEIKAVLEALLFVSGEPLSVEHGFPLRLVIPGYYGTNSVKWLGALELTEKRSTGMFTTDLYNDPDGAGGTRPVWEAGPEAIIVAPKNHSTLRPGAVDVWGWAWSDKGVAKVEISADNGLTWLATRLGNRRQWSWQRFSGQCVMPREASLKLMARATDAEGASQPLRRARNAVHVINIRATAR